MPAEHLGRVYMVSVRGGDPNRRVPEEELFRALRDGARSFDATVAARAWLAPVQAGTRSEDQMVGVVGPGTFEMLGVRPAEGRVFGRGEDAAQGAVISFALWRRYFGGRPLAEGLRLQVGHNSYTVVGVVPRGMHLLGDDVWVPLEGVVRDSANRVFDARPVVRLRPGVTLAEAEQEMVLVGRRLDAAYGSAARPIAAQLYPLGRPPRAAQEYQLVMLVASGIVLLIACANLGTMLLARGLDRRRQTAIRVALGASRGAIVRETLAECGVLAGGGGLLGVLLTFAALGLLVHWTPPQIPDIGDLRPLPGWRTFVFAFGATAATVVLAGLLPALRAASVQPSEPLKDGAAGATGTRRDRYSPLVILEVALATTLLMGTALLSLSMLHLRDFQALPAMRQMVSASLWVQRAGGDRDLARTDARYAEIVARLAAMPGVREVATSHEERTDDDNVYAESGRSGEHWLYKRTVRVVSDAYVRTFGMRIVAGRDFAPGDASAREPGVVIVDANAARRLWPDLASPVGRMVRLGGPRSTRPWLRVVGVVAATSPDDPDPGVYVLYPRDGERRRLLFVRGDGDRALLALQVRRELQRIAPEQLFPQVGPYLASHERRVETAAFFASLFSGFSAFALALCAVGLYGVLAYTVSRRLREFAVRVALGARRRDVVRLVLHDAAVMALGGIGIGAFVAIAATSAMAGAGDFGTRYPHVVALVAAEAVLMVVAIAACTGPALQATRADPVEILRAS